MNLIPNTNGYLISYPHYQAEYTLFNALVNSNTAFEKVGSNQMPQQRSFIKIRSKQVLPKGKFKLDS